MTSENWQKRLTDIILGMMDGADGELPSDFASLYEDIQAAFAKDPSNEPLAEIKQSMEMLKQSLSDPLTAEAFADYDPSTFEPQPEIFNAIDACDITGIKSALKTWDINQTSGEFNSTALYQAMSGFDMSLEVIDTLLEAGADPRKGLGKTGVLHGLGFAEIKNIRPEALAKIITRCVSLGADIEQRSDHLQWTPLITAASEWNPIATEALLLAGANVHAHAGDVDGVYGAGDTATTFADGHPETLAILNRYMSAH